MVLKIQAEFFFRVGYVPYTDNITNITAKNILSVVLLSWCRVRTLHQIHKNML